MLKIQNLVREEEAASAVRKDKSLMSVEDVKKDYAKLRDQSNYLEERIVSLQKITESNGIENKNKGLYRTLLGYSVISRTSSDQDSRGG